MDLVEERRWKEKTTIIHPSLLPWFVILPGSDQPVEAGQVVLFDGKAAPTVKRPAGVAARVAPKQWSMAVPRGSSDGTTATSSPGPG